MMSLPSEPISLKMVQVFQELSQKLLFIDLRCSKKNILSERENSTLTTVVRSFSVFQTNNTQSLRRPKSKSNSSINFITFTLKLRIPSLDGKILYGLISLKKLET
jgi:hypothetical protein